MPATTTQKAEFKATKAEHPAGWWPLVDSWCRSVEWAQRTLVYEIGPPLVKAKFVIDIMKGPYAANHASPPRNLTVKPCPRCHS